MQLTDILQARKRIAPYVRRTPLIRSTWLSDLAQADVFLKVESLQPSHSFKWRGAFNAVIARRERGDANDTPLVTASAGNHGRALAAAAEMFRLPLIVFTPSDAPQAKVAAICRHGAALRAVGRDYDDAERQAKAYAKASGAAFVSPYSDPDVIAGAGTVALEVFEDLSPVDSMVIPIGGGGLISGMAAVAKSIAPTCAITGVEADASHPFQTSIRAGHLVEIVPGPTLADGLAGNPDPDTITFAFIQRLVDRIVTVSESDLTAAIVGLVEHEHLVAEGAGAAAAAALIGKRVGVAGTRVVVVVSGGNIDRARLAALLG
jgi:threonine dehydratase